MDSHQVSPRNFRALILEKAFFFLGFSFAGPFTVLTALASQLTTSAVLIGSISTVWNGALFAPVPFVARWIRHHSERMPIIRRALFSRATAFVLVAAWLFITRAQNPGLTLLVLMLGMLIFCVSDGFNSIPYVDLIARIMNSRERSRMTWQGMLAGGVLSIVGSIVVQRVLTPGTLSFPLNFAVLLGAGCVCFFMAVAMISFIRERDVQTSHAHTVEGDDVQAPRALQEILRHDVVYRRMLLTRFLTNLDQMVIPFYTVYALTVLKLSPETVGLFVAAQAVGSLIGPLVYGWIAERVGAQRVIQLSALVQAIGVAEVLVIVLFASETPALGPFIALAFVVTGLSNSSMALGYYNYPLDWCPGHDRPNYLALLSIISATSMLAPLLGGFLAQTFSYAVLFAVTTVLVSAGIVVSSTLPNKRRA